MDIHRVSKKLSRLVFVRTASNLKLSELVLEVCPTCTDTSAQTAVPLADRGINDRLVELRPLVDETRFEFIDVNLTILNTGVIGTYNFAK